uniref:Tripartite motif-containing protein 2-like n=1 Tax=Saccoglossus kowalevskii TaxID=10224 RepID=A0ABM0MPQ7_SACKO|nr:PREDICTED: tripartite motif-containing protein 2-like [Saccoglossus kowalevskii]
MATSISVEKISEELLKCPVCLERYNRPRMLPCQHSFCEQCLAKLFVQREHRCPVCRSPCSVERVEQLQSSMLINTVLVMVKEQKLKTGVQSCTLHEKHTVDLYCQACQTPICRICNQSGHSGHRVIDMNVAVDEFRGVVSYYIDTWKEKQKVAHQNKSQAMKRSEVLKTSHAREQRKITKHAHDTISKLKKLISQQMDKRLSELGSKYGVMNEEIKRQIRQFETTEELLTSTTTFMENLVKFGNAAQIMKDSKDTLDQLQTMTSVEAKWNEVANSLPRFKPGDIKLHGNLGTFEDQHTSCSIQKPEIVLASSTEQGNGRNYHGESASYIPNISNCDNHQHGPPGTFTRRNTTSIGEDEDLQSESNERHERSDTSTTDISIPKFGNIQRNVAGSHGFAERTQPRPRRVSSSVAERIRQFEQKFSSNN